MNWKKKKDNPEAQAPEAAAAGKGPAAFWKKNWKLLVPAVCGIVAGGAFLLWPKQAKPASVDASYTEAAPEYRNVSNTLSGTGTLNPANTYTVKSLVDGKVLTSTIEEGDTVDEGTVLYTIDSSDASTNFEKAEIAMQQAQRSYDKVVDRQYVRAEVAGTVSSLKVNKGDEVTSGQEVAVIRDSSKMLLTLEFPAADAANFSVGQSADVTLDGTFEQLTGTVTSVTFRGMQYDIIVDFRGFKWLIQTTDHCPEGARIGIKIDPDGIHVMKKSAYSGMFGDYSSFSEEYDELDDATLSSDEEESGDEE